MEFRILFVTLEKLLAFIAPLAFWAVVLELLLVDCIYVLQAKQACIIFAGWLRRAGYEKGHKLDANSQQ